MAAPEGNYWFYHKTLKSNTFDPCNREQFYSTIWLEVETNLAFLNRNGKVPRIPWQGHPRGGKQEWPVQSNYSTAYARHKYMTAMVGRTNRKIKRYKKVHGQFDYHHLYDRQNETMVGLVPVDMPTLEEKYLWVDMTYALRGIYFPKRHIAHPKYSNRCLYFRMSFLDRPVSLKTYAIDRPAPQGEIIFKGYGSNYYTRQEKERRKREGFPEKDPDKTLPSDTLHEGSLEIIPNGFKGWDVRPQWTVRFDVEVIMHIASICPDLFKREELLKPEYTDPYKFVALFDCRWIDLRDGDESFTMNFGDHTVDYLKAVEDEKHMKLQLANNGFDEYWFAKTVGGMLLVGASLIPGYGPMLAMGGQVMLDLMVAPEEFEKHMFAKDRAALVVATIISSAKEGKGYVLKRVLDNVKRPIAWDKYAFLKFKTK